MLREGPISAAVSVALSTTTEMLLSQKSADPGILLMKAASGVEFAETGLGGGADRIRTFGSSL
jgi:hypothetical protein